MNTLCQIETGAHRQKASGLREKMVPSNERIHLLSVGSFERSFELHDAFLVAPCRQLSVTGNCLELSMIPEYRQLWIIPRQEAIHLAILHDTLHSFELDETARLIRHHWPEARILLISTEEGILDDAMYDDRIEPAASPQDLLSVIDRLLEKRRE